LAIVDPFLPWMLIGPIRSEQIIFYVQLLGYCLLAYQGRSEMAKPVDLPDVKVHLNQQRERGEVPILHRAIRKVVLVSLSNYGGKAAIDELFVPWNEPRVTRLSAAASAARR
jgi:hypothetical protein